MKNPDVWEAGFTLPALSMITQMSGLVDVLDVYWHPTNHVVIFTVARKHKKLFQEGSLRGNKVKKLLLHLEPVLVDACGIDQTLQVEQGVGRFV